MARWFAAGVIAGMVVTLVAGAAVGLHAQSQDDEVQQAAAQAGVDPTDLAGAVNSTQVDPYTYLQSTGELASPPGASSAGPPGQQTTPAASPRVDCIIRYESRGNASAVNPRTGAAGLGQFVKSTWATTPQGRAGLSVFDPVANRSAIGWMLSVGRAREFSVVTAGLC
jgi:hypothetical protein